MRRFGQTRVQNHSNRAHRTHTSVSAGPAGNLNQPMATSEAETNRYKKAGRAQVSLREIKPEQSHVLGINKNIYVSPNGAYSTQNAPHTMTSNSSNRLQRPHIGGGNTPQNYTYGNSNNGRKHQAVSHIMPIDRKHQTGSYVMHPGGMSGK